MQYHMHLWMLCFLKKVTLSDCTSSAMVLMASKHVIWEMIRECGEWKRKRRSDICEYLEICYAVRGSRCDCCFSWKKSGLTIRLKIKGDWFPYNTTENALLSPVNLVRYYHERNLPLPPISFQLWEENVEKWQCPSSEPRPQEAV